MTRHSLLAVVAYGLFAAFVGAAHAGDTYKDQEIVPKRERLFARVDSTVVGTEMEFDWPVKVERVNGQWLWITDDGHFSEKGRPTQGWVSKNDVVLLEEDPIENKKSALAYLSDRVREDRNAGWAYWLRGLVFEDKGDWVAAKEDEREAIKNAPEGSPWLDDAWERLAYCERKQALVEHAAIFERFRKHEKPKLSWGDVPQSLRDAVCHFRQAALIRRRPKTFRDWGDALGVQDWNRFQRRIWSYYLEDPDSFDFKDPESFDTYLEKCRKLDPFEPDGSISALCLYDRALDVFPSYAGAYFGRGAVFEYVADHQIYKMTQLPEWKKSTKAEKVNEKLRASQGALKKLKDELEPIVEEMDRLANLRTTDFHAWRIEELRETRAKKQNEIDEWQSQVESLKKEYEHVVAKQQATLSRFDRLQLKTLGSIKWLTDHALCDYAAAVAADQESTAAFRDRAAVSLMLLDPTGSRQITSQAFTSVLAEANGMDFGRAELANRALQWAETAAAQSEYGNEYALETLAAALNSTASFKDAVRREKSAWEHMDKEKKTFGTNFIELYEDNESNAPKNPK